MSIIDEIASHIRDHKIGGPDSKTEEVFDALTKAFPRANFDQIIAGLREAARRDMIEAEELRQYGKLRAGKGH